MSTKPLYGKLILSDLTSYRVNNVLTILDFLLQYYVQYSRYIQIRHHLALLQLQRVEDIIVITILILFKLKIALERQLCISLVIPGNLAVIQLTADKVVVFITITQVLFEREDTLVRRVNLLLELVDYLFIIAEQYPVTIRSESDPLVALVWPMSLEVELAYFGGLVAIPLYL